MKIKMSATEQYGTQEKESCGGKREANQIRNESIVYPTPFETSSTAKCVSARAHVCLLPESSQGGDSLGSEHGCVTPWTRLGTDLP